jgi:hypothetical protein
MSSFGENQCFDGGAIDPPQEDEMREQAFEDWRDDRTVDTELDDVLLCLDCFKAPVVFGGRWRGLAGLVRDGELRSHWQEKHEDDGRERDPDDEYDRRVEDEADHKRECD